MPVSSDFDRLRIVLVNARNPLNIGAAARAMSNFGFLRLRVVTPYDPAFRRARSAVGAAPVLESTEEFATVAEAIADCTLVVGTSAVGAREVRHPLHRLQEGASQIRQHMASGNVALLFGSEKFGLSNEDLAYCHWLLHIPTREEHLSMNLGQAVAVCCYELAREAARQSLAEPGVLASGEDIERISVVMIEALRTSGYQAPGTAGSTERKARRLLRRLNLQHADSLLLLGMFRQMLWKLRGAKHGERFAPEKTDAKSVERNEAEEAEESED